MNEYIYYTGKDTDLFCKFKSCRQKGSLILNTFVADYHCENCGRWQKMELSSYYQPILKINSKHIKEVK